MQYISNFAFYVALKFFWDRLLGAPVWKPDPNFEGGPAGLADAPSSYKFGGAGGNALRASQSAFQICRQVRIIILERRIPSLLNWG
jgi:hypothetical protein